MAIVTIQIMQFYKLLLVNMSKGVKAAEIHISAFSLKV